MSLDASSMGMKRHRSMGRESGPAERRKQSNRMAQKKYREKIADQTKRLENFAQQARRLLTEAADLDISEPHCPECSHCQSAQRDQAPSGMHEESSTSRREPQDDVYASSANPLQQPRDRGDCPEATNGTLSLCDSHMVSTGTFTPQPSQTARITEPSTPEMSNAAASSKSSDMLATFLALPTPLSDHDFIDRQDMTDTDFLNHEISLNTPGAASFTPHLGLHWEDSAAMQLAAREGQTGILSILLRTGFYVDSRDEKGRTPLHQCAIHGHIEAAKLLLSAGADVKSTDAEGTSVILAAVKARCEEMVELLLNCKQ